MISAEEMARAAEAARLETAPEEIESFLRGINGLFDFVRRRWETVNVEGVPPTAYVRPLKNLYRPDTRQPSLSRDVVLANAPEAENGCFRVPRIIEE